MTAGDDNYKKLRAELDSKLKSDSRLRAIAAKISAGTADFKDTSEYTRIVARYMGEVISSNIGNTTNPAGKEMVCKALLRDEYESINGVLGETQTSIDDKLGIHIKPVKPAFPTERVDKAAHSLEDPTVPESTIKRRARSTSENITNSFHDDYIKENAKLRSKAGLKCYITRETDGKCCPWCSGIAGRYEYGTEPHDIYRRHDNCGCTVTYENGRQRQDVWSKRTWEAPEPNAGAEKPKVFSREQAERLNAENMPKRLTGGENGGIIKTEEFHCYGDYLRDSMGSAKDNNHEQLIAIKNDVESKGGKLILLRDNTKMVCNVKKGEPGTIEVDENISLGGLMHEYRHFLDDMENGNPGLAFYLQNRDAFFNYEKRGYEEELKIALEIGDKEAEKKILGEIEKRRKEIYGE